MVGFLIISYINSMYFPSFWLPWNANVVFAAAPFFYVGYLYKVKNIEINNNILISLGVFILFLSAFFVNNGYDMKVSNYGIPVVTFLSSLILILSIKYLSEKLAKFSFTNKSLSEIGKASMVIMYMHLPIQYIISSYYDLNNIIVFFIALLSSYMLYLFLAKSRWTRALFLGSSYDLKVLSRTYGWSGGFISKLFFILYNVLRTSCLKLRVILAEANI